MENTPPPCRERSSDVGLAKPVNLADPDVAALVQQLIDAADDLAWRVQASRKLDRLSTSPAVAIDDTSHGRRPIGTMLRPRPNRRTDAQPGLYDATLDRIRRALPRCRVGESVGALFIPVSDRGAVHSLRRLRGVELAVALFDAASPPVPGNDDTDMVRASPLACSGDFLLRLAVCQG